MLRVSLFACVLATASFGSSILQAEHLCPSDGTSYFATLAQSAEGRLASRHILKLDRDHDGLPDCLERSLGLHERRADSDDDGIPDGDEMYGDTSLGELFAAGAFDSDGDGLSDSDEKGSGDRREYIFAGTGEPSFIHVVALKPSLRTAEATVSKCKGLKGPKKKKCLKKNAGSASPSPSVSPSPGASVKPTPKPAAQATPSSTSGDASRGKSFFSSNCTSCHGTQRISSESQLKSILDTQPQHVLIKNMVSSQTLKDVAAYLMSL